MFVCSMCMCMHVACGKASLCFLSLFALNWNPAEKKLIIIYIVRFHMLLDVLVISCFLCTVRPTHLYYHLNTFIKIL